MSKQLDVREKSEDEPQKYCTEQAKSELDLAQFKEIAARVPRVPGERIQWVLPLNTMVCNHI